jgi:hypothetical protein
MEMYVNFDFYVVLHTWRIKTLPNLLFIYFLVENKDLDRICETECTAFCTFCHWSVFESCHEFQYCLANVAKRG